MARLVHATFRTGSNDDRRSRDRGHTHHDVPADIRAREQPPVNIAETRRLAAAQPIRRDDIDNAQEIARATGRRVVNVLEEQLALAPAELLVRLAATFHFPAIALNDVHELAPAFDVVPY